MDKGCTKRKWVQNLCIFDTEKLLCEFACEFYQDPMRAAIRVPKQGHDDVLVPEVKERLRAISGETSELAEQSKLNAVPAVRVSLLCCSQVDLKIFYKILNVHCCLLALSLSELVLLY